MSKIYPKKTAIMLVSLFITIQAISIVLLSNITTDVEVERELNDLPNKSGPIPYSIVVNDTDPALSWAAWDAKNPPWLSGNGLQGTPYKIQDIIIDGRGNNESCIVINNSRAYFEIDNATCKNAASGGIFAKGGLFIKNSTNGYVHDSIFLDNVEAGITIENSTDCAFEHNVINGIDGIGIYSDVCTNLKINWNNLSNIGDIGISPSNTNDTIIQGNIIHNTSSTGIQLDSDQTNVSISENEIYNAGVGGSGEGIEISSGAQWITVSDNYINNSRDRGVRIIGSDNCTVIRNNIRNSGDSGITIETNSLNTTIYENLVNKTLGYGICVYSGSHSANITRNIVLNTTNIGICIFDADFCTVHWNDVNGSLSNGMKLDPANYCTVTYNTIYFSTTYGIETDSHYVKTYLNNFIKNQLAFPLLSQGYADTDTNNEFNSSTHGNYWSNHLDRYPNSQPCPAPNDYYWNFGYGIGGYCIDNRSLVKQTRGPLSWPMVNPFLDVTPVSALINKVRCAAVNVRWYIEYNADITATQLNYKIYVNGTLVKTSSISREKISDGISYYNSTLYSGDWKVSIFIEDGMGLQDSSDVLIRNIAPLTITAEEYPKTAFEVGNTTVLINWTVTVETGVSLTKIEIYINGTLNATIMVGTGEEQWNYSGLKPYYVFNNLSLLPVGVYYFSCRIYYTIDGNTCSWDSTAILVNVIEAAADGGPGFIIPGYDLLIVMGIIFVGTIVFYKKKAKKIEAG